jgi:hypothetical protein
MLTPLGTSVVGVVVDDFLQETAENKTRTARTVIDLFMSVVFRNDVTLQGCKGTP